MFSSMEAAIDFVQHVLRDEWTVEVDADTDHPRNLADCRGMAFPKGSSIKSSDAYYSEDGMEAWAAGGRGRYAIKVVPYRGEGIRVCNELRGGVSRHEQKKANCWNT